MLRRQRELPVIIELLRQRLDRFGLFAAIEYMQLNMQRILQDPLADALRYHRCFRGAVEQPEEIRIIIGQHIIELDALLLRQLRQQDRFQDGLVPQAPVIVLHHIIPP